jgi:hypothetical protein
VPGASEHNDNNNNLLWNEQNCNEILRIFFNNKLVNYDIGLDEEQCSYRVRGRFLYQYVLSNIENFNASVINLHDIETKKEKSIANF